MSNTEGRNGDASRVDVVIVGAGPAGLAAGLQLVKAGLSVAIVERDRSEVGGIARTVRHGDFRFDLAEHRGSTTLRQVAELWDELLPEGMVALPRTTRVHRGTASYQPRRAEHALALVRSADRFVDRANAWASTLRRSPQAAAAPHTGAPTVAVDDFRYPRFGVGAIWEAARDRIVASGRGRVMMGHELSRLAADGSGNWRLSAVGPEGTVTFRARHVINTLPLREFVPRLHPLPAGALEIEQLRYDSSVTVALFLRGAQPFAEASVRIEASGLKAKLVRNIRAWSPEMLADTHLNCVCVDFVVGEADDLASLNDDLITYLAMAELHVLGLADHRSVDRSTVVRLSNALPVADPESTERAQRIRDELQAMFPTLHLAGRHGLHVACDLDGETEFGLEVARRVLDAPGHAVESEAGPLRELPGLIASAAASGGEGYDAASDEDLRPARRMAG